MCKNCSFVNKGDVKSAKSIIVSAIENIRLRHKNKFGKYFNFSIVGSAKRKLTYRKGNSKWDIDFQIWVNRNLLEFELGDAKSIRQWFFEEFKKQLNNNYSVKNSSSVITLNPRNSNNNVSFDIAIISKDIQTNKNSILYIDKSKEIDNYIWNELPVGSENYSKLNKNIKGIEQWDFLKEKYIGYKCPNHDKEKDKQKSSTELLSQAINDTLQKFNL